MKDYWSMSDEELMAEALKYNIPHGITMGRRTWIDRKATIEQLLARDAALATQKTPLPQEKTKPRKIGF